MSVPHYKVDEQLKEKSEEEATILKKEEQAMTRMVWLL